MVRKDSTGFWIRLTALIGLFIVACGALAWQWRNFDWKATVAKVKAFDPRTRKLLPTPHAADLDQLNELRLQQARTKAKEIAALLKVRKSNESSPFLGVPIVFAASTRKKLREHQVRFRLRELSAYQKLTADPPEAKIAGERFLKDYLTQVAESDFHSPDVVELDKLGRAALDAGSRDPMVRTYHAYAHWSATSDVESSKRSWIDVLPDLAQSKYPRKVELYARLFLRDLTRVRPFDSDIQPFRALPVAQIVQTLEDEGTEGEWRANLCERALKLLNNASTDEKEALLLGLLRSDSIDEYLIHYLLGNHYVTLAWDHRGSGYANTVSQDQWRQFRLHARVASDHLQYAWFLQPDLPYATNSLITLGMAGEGTQEPAHFWFLRTLEAQFDYYDAYGTMINSLLPRWGGSHENMLVFASNCLATDRFDTVVPYIVVDVLESIRDRDEVDLRNLPAVSKLLRDFTTQRNAYRARLPDVRMYEDNGAYRADLVQLLEKCQLLDLAAAEIRAAGDNINWTQLRYHQSPARYLAARLIASRGPAGRQVIAFDEKLRQPWDVHVEADKLEALSREYQELKSRIPADDAANAYFIHAGVILDQLRQFSSGDWTELRIGKDLEGWEPYCDAWWTKDDDSVELSCRFDKAKQVNLRPLANFQPPLEIEATLELLDPEPYPNRAGIGWSREGPDEKKTIAMFPIFAIESSPYKLVGQPFARRDFVQSLGISRYGGRYALNSTGAHRMRLKLWNEIAEFRVDEIVWSTPPLAIPWDRQGFLCFGTNMDRFSHGSLRLSQIRIRKLIEQPVPAESEPFEVRIKYWEARQSIDRGFDPVTMGRLCRLRYEQGRFDEVISLVDEIIEKYPGINDVQVWKARAFLASRHDETAAMKILEDLRRNETRDDEEVMSTMAEIMSMTRNDTLRNGTRALNIATISANSSSLKHARSLAAMAAAYAELGQFDNAVSKLQQALELASESEKAEWEPRMPAYHAGKTYRYAEPTTQEP